VCFCEVVARDPFYLVGSNYRPEFRLAELPSLRFAAVSEAPTPWMCLQHDLREQGIDPSTVDRAAERPMAENFEALCDQQIDVVQVLEPFASMALQRGAGQILYAASTRGPTVYTTFITTPDRIERHRVSFGGMTRAIQQMQRWLFEHRAEELAEVTADFFPDIARDILVSSLRRYQQAGFWTRTPDVSRQGFARLGESLLSGGFIFRMPLYEDCVDQSLR
jgi:NitT/TauT family transport system substrate-binding protein